MNAAKTGRALPAWPVLTVRLLHRMMDPGQPRYGKEAWKEQKQWSRAKVRVVNAPLAKPTEQDLVLASKNLDFFDDKWLHTTLVVTNAKKSREGCLEARTEERILRPIF